MNKYMWRKITAFPYDLISEIWNLRRDFINHFNEEPNLLYMSKRFYFKLLSNAVVREKHNKSYIFGMRIGFKSDMEENSIRIEREDNMEVDGSIKIGNITIQQTSNGFYYFPREGSLSNDIKLPKRYIINKGATILFWKDGSKTVVKRGKDDEYNKVLGFLWAYFQKHSGLSRNKANKYLAELLDEEVINEKK